MVLDSTSSRIVLMVVTRFSLSLGDANRQISDLKFKLAKSEQEITALEQNVS